MKGTVIAVIAVIVALVVGLGLGYQLAGATPAAANAGDKGDSGSLTDAQKKILTDQVSLAIMARSEEIAKGIIDDAIRKGVDRDALKLVAEKAKTAVPTAQRGSDRRRAEEDPNKRYTVDVGKSYARGPKDAPITIMAFSEFQCPFCGRAHKTMTQIEKEYPGKVRFIFKAKILPSHSKAPLAHNAALAAGEQGKFWEMHDIIFEHQREMGRDKYIEWAKEIGVPYIDKFIADMDQKDRYKDFLAAEAADSGKVGVRGTPTFLVNGRKIRGAQPFESFKAVIDEELKSGK